MNFTLHKINDLTLFSNVKLNLGLKYLLMTSIYMSFIFLTFLSQSAQFCQKSGDIYFTHFYAHQICSRKILMFTFISLKISNVWPSLQDYKQFSLVKIFKFYLWPPCIWALFSWHFKSSCTVFPSILWYLFYTFRFPGKF